MTLPTKMDPNDPSKIAIDWEGVQRAPQKAKILGS